MTASESPTPTSRAGTGPTLAEVEVTTAMIDAAFDAPLCAVGKGREEHEASECPDCARLFIAAAVGAMVAPRVTTEMVDAALLAAWGKRQEAYDRKVVAEHITAAILPAAALGGPNG